MNFSDGLKYYRAQQGITQKDLASAVGVNNTTISNWEKGIAKPDLDTLVRLSNYFGVCIDDLVFFDANREERPLSVPTISPNHEALYKEMLSVKDKIIARDEELITTLRQRIRDLERGDSPLENPVHSARTVRPTSHSSGIPLSRK